MHQGNGLHKRSEAETLMNNCSAVYSLEFVPSCNALLEIPCELGQDAGEAISAGGRNTSGDAPSMLPGSRKAMLMSHPGPMYSHSFHQLNLTCLNSGSSSRDSSPVLGWRTVASSPFGRDGRTHQCEQVHVMKFGRSTKSYSLHYLWARALPE